MNIVNFRNKSFELKEKINVICGDNIDEIVSLNPRDIRSWESCPVCGVREINDIQKCIDKLEIDGVEQITIITNSPLIIEYLSKSQQDIAFYLTENDTLITDEDNSTILEQIFANYNKAFKLLEELESSDVE